MNNIVPILITCDLDPTPEVPLIDKKNALDLTSLLFDRYGIKATVFVVANIAVLYHSQIRNLLVKGHEVGCHGLTHDLEEDYSRLPGATQRQYLTRATQMLEDICGNAIISFRGPMVKISSMTLEILEELNYRIDSSVCSQRFDLVSSNLFNPGWIFAPRRPYQPGHTSPYKKGNRNLWEIPVSALVLPFISGILYVFGNTMMKKFFDVLYFEAKRTGKPIVYLFHPVEFARHRQVQEKIPLQGLYFRRRLKLNINERQRLDATRELFEYIAAFDDTQFMTMSEYLNSSYFNKEHPSKR